MNAQTKMKHQTPSDIALVNAENEAFMLSMLMLENRRVDLVADILQPEDFGEPLFGRIYQRIVQLVSVGQQATPVTLRNDFIDDPAMQELGGTSFLAQLTGSPGALIMRAADCANLIIDMASRRRLVEVVSKVANDASDFDKSLQELIDETDAALVASVERREAARQDTLCTSIGRAIARIDEIRENSGRVGATTGIEEFDNLLGGLKGGQMVVIAGRPGMGKTAVACSAAIGLARNGHGVLDVSLEMVSEELGGRMVADLCCWGPHDGVSYDSIINGTCTAPHMERIREAEKFAQTLPLQILDIGTCSLARLALAVRRTKRQMAAKAQKLEVVIVDYLQLMQPSQRGMSAYESVSEISKGLKALAKELEVCVIALAQLSRAVESREDKRPQLSDLRDSGQIEQDADAVMFLYREEYYLAKAKPRNGQTEAHEAAISNAAGKLSLILAKRRNGPTGDATCLYLSHFQSVRSFYWGRQ